MSILKEFDLNWVRTKNPPLPKIRAQWFGFVEASKRDIKITGIPSISLLSMKALMLNNYEHLLLFDYLTSCAGYTHTHTHTHIYLEFIRLFWQDVRIRTVQTKGGDSVCRSGDNESRALRHEGRRLEITISCNDMDDYGTLQLM
jgi:hypothetical protein